MASESQSFGSKKNCVFCKIAAKEQESRIIFEDEKTVVFPDIRPAAKHHYLVIPKEHYGNPKSLTSVDLQVVEHLFEVGKSAITNSGADSEDVLYGYHWPPFNSIQHLHLHVIYPGGQMGFFARQIFRPNSFWFVTHEWLLEHLKKNSAGQSC
ncbi:histidine triad nucleotide-binding protein 3-like [Stylophora pistillata]|uniref:histidine triad nucleotide-binding protein 3-like n=1 Tax=Stylophora pistillata TaxID=50429 RepID=UPI000C050913|nr:histidine triad nucleotide-binding protein 3-like [Stylophora pistillata]